MTERIDITENGRTLCYADYYTVLDEMEIVCIYTDTEYRRRGLASGLMDRLIEICLERNIAVIRLEVRESNTAAIGLYGKYGFVTVGRRKNYYKDPKEDALLMDLTIKGGTD